MDERHLEHDVVAVGHRVADPLDPGLERLTALLVLRRHLEHRLALGPVAVEHGRLVIHPLLQQQRRHLAERAALDHQRPRVELVLQGEEVRAVEPRGDLRRCQESIHNATSVVRGCVIAGQPQVAAMSQPLAMMNPWTTNAGAPHQFSEEMYADLHAKYERSD